MVGYVFYYPVSFYMYRDLLSPIHSFLLKPTPDAWIEEAKKKENLPIILRDHMLCELKAAQSAKVLNAWIKPYEDFAYLYRGSFEELRGKSQFSKKITPKANCAYGQDLIEKMVLLIKEELHHYYQVLELMKNKSISYQNVTASRYAKGLLKHVKTYEPDALVDKLIIGAFIEARSCERFAKLAPYLDDDISKFYISLLRSEARHYQDYLSLAQQISQSDIQDRIDYFASVEAELITSEDDEFRFHSGSPSLKYNTDK